MFKWHHQYSVEVDAPIHLVLNFFYNFDNWPKWIDQFDSMHVEKVEGNTTTIKAKIKNRNAYALLFFTEIVPQKKFQMSYKGLCFTQLSNIHYEKISPLKTAVLNNSFRNNF